MHGCRSAAAAWLPQFRIETGSLQAAWVNGAYCSMQDAGIRPIVAVEREIDAAVRGYLAGTLENHEELAH
jgi:hypothetical protein